MALDSQAQNIALMTTDFPFYTKAYLKILEASKTYTRGLEAIFYNAHNDFTWQPTVLLAPLVPSDDHETVFKKIAVTSIYLDIWVIRRVVNFIRVGYSSVSYAMWLLCRDIRRKSLDELVHILDNKLREDEVTFQGSASKGRKGLEGLSLNQFSRRYIFHLLARITTYSDLRSGRSDLFQQYVDRNTSNPYDIEHIWANDYAGHENDFSTEQEFQECRNHIASLLLLPADVNRSLQDKSYPEKIQKYAMQNVFAASLSANMYQHQPQFTAFKTAEELPFRPYNVFRKQEQKERRDLVAALVARIWSPDRLKEAAR